MRTMLDLGTESSDSTPNSVRTENDARALGQSRGQIALMRYGASDRSATIAGPSPLASQSTTGPERLLFASIAPEGTCPK